MKKIKYLLLILFAVFCCVGIVACKNNGSPKKLSAPQNLHMEGRTLVWDEDENASYYLVYCLYERRTEEASADLSDLPAPYTYDIEVMAVGDGKNYEDSDWEKISYTPVKILEYGYDEIGFKYTLLDDRSGYEVSRGDLSYNDYKIRGFIEFPDYFCNLPVKKIADNMFYSGELYLNPEWTPVGCNNVTTGVKLPQKLETIGSMAFAYCLSLEDIVIPDSVTEIGARAFHWCEGIKDINIPYGIKSIEGSSFSFTSITKIYIPDSVVSIGGGAFYWCKNLTSITIPDSVISLGSCAFEACSNLTEVILPEGLEEIGSSCFQSCYALTKINAPQSVKRLNNRAFFLCRALSDIPVFNNLEYMSDEVFDGTPWFKSQPNDGFVIYGDDILYRYNGALPEGGVIDSLPSQIKLIAGGAFRNIEELTSIYIPDSVDIIGERTFSNCENLTSIRLPQGLTNIYDGTFKNCKALQSLVIPKGVTSIGQSAFESTNMTEIILPIALKIIGHQAFFRSKIKDFYYAGTVEQWKAIEKDSDLVSNKATDLASGKLIYTVHCTDGDITKS